MGYKASSYSTGWKSLLQWGRNHPQIQIQIPVFCIPSLPLTSGSDLGRAGQGLCVCVNFLNTLGDKSQNKKFIPQLHLFKLSAPQRSPVLTGFCDDDLSWVLDSVISKHWSCQRTWIWANSGRQRRTEESGMLQPMGLQRVRCFSG